MVGGPLNDDVSLGQCLFDAVVQDQLDGALEDDAEVDALRAVHDVDVVLGVARRREVDDAAVHARGADQPDLLAVHICPRPLRFGRHPVGAEQIREPWDDPAGRLAFRVQWVRRREHLVAIEDGFAVAVVP